MRYIFLLLMAVAILSCRVKKVEKDNPNAPFKVEFPNAFSINAEPPGDKFCITINKTLCADCYKAAIYNRWGEQAWESNNPDQCWNGNHYKTNLPLPAGTYFVIVTTKYNGEEFSNKGSVTLIR